MPESDDRLFLHHLKFVRDADKIDILRVVTEYYAGHYGCNAVAAGLPGTPDVADAVLQSVIGGRMVNISDVRSLNDFKLLQEG